MHDYGPTLMAVFAAELCGIFLFLLPKLDSLFVLHFKFDQLAEKSIGSSY
jgi:hypothetical protein